MLDCQVIKLNNDYQFIQLGTALIPIPRNLLGYASILRERLNTMIIDVAHLNYQRDRLGRETFDALLKFPEIDYVVEIKYEYPHSAMIVAWTDATYGKEVQVQEIEYYEGIASFKPLYGISQRKVNEHKVQYLVENCETSILVDSQMKVVSLIGPEVDCVSVQVPSVGKRITCN